MKLLASVVATTIAVQSDNLCPSYDPAIYSSSTGGCYEQQGTWVQNGAPNAIRCKMTNDRCLQVKCNIDGIQAEFRHDLFDDNPNEPRFISQIKSGARTVYDKNGDPLVAGPCDFSVGSGNFGGNSLNIDWKYKDCHSKMDIQVVNDEIVYSVKLSVPGDDPTQDIEFYVDHKMEAACKYPTEVVLDPQNFWVNQEDVSAAGGDYGDLAGEFSCDFYSDPQRTQPIESGNIVNMGDTIYGQVTSSALYGLSYNLKKVTVSDAQNNNLSFDVIENGASVATVSSNIVNNAVTGSNIDFDWMSFGFQGKFDQNQLSVQCFVDLKPNNIPTCPTDYELVELSGGNKQCMQINKGQFKWETAKSTCEGDNAWMAYPENEEDNKILSDLIGYGKYDLWIGVECGASSLGGYPNKPNKPYCDKWENVQNGDEVTWTNWRTKEPNNAKGNEFMVHIILTDNKNKAYGEPGNYSPGQRNGKWNDHISHDHEDWADRIKYKYNNAFICQKAPNYN